MFRRSLILVLALALLTLAFTAGYALLPLRKPTDLLDDATAKLARGEAVAAVTLLDRSESSPAFARDPELRRKLWTLRLQAHRQLDLAARALADIDNLMADGQDSPGLRMERIYYLAKMGKGDEARAAGLEFTKQNPTVARGLELTGEACKVAYAEPLRKAAAKVRADLGYENEREGVSALLELLYRPDGDPAVPAAKQRLESLYAKENRLAQAWPAFHDQIAELRGRIQEATQLFQSALELAGQDNTKRSGLFAAAFQGVAYSLQQSGRADDLDAQCEIYLSSFSHRYRTEAAAIAVAARYRDGLFESAVELSNRFAPMATFAADFGAGKFTPHVRSLLLTHCVSLYRLGRLEDLVTLAQTLTPLAANAPSLHGIANLAWGFNHTLRKVQQYRTDSFAWPSDLMMRDAPPQDGPDLLDVVMPLRIESAATDGKPVTDLVETIDKWAAARPANPLPLMLRARTQLRFGQDAAAMATATAILQARPTDEEALRVLAEAADLAYKGSQQDGNSLLMQCLQRNTDRPDSPPHPVCYLLCGEAALRQQHPWIALTCARLAADRFPWSEWPFLLEARAEQVRGKPADAVEDLARLLERKPDSVEALRLSFDICVQHDLPLANLLWRAMPKMGQSNAALAELLRAALEAGSPESLSIARRAVETKGANADLLALTATAFARHGTVADARAAIRLAYEHPGAKDPSVSQSLLSATLACLHAEAESMSDEDLSKSVHQELMRTSWRGPESARKLVATAKHLANKKKPAAASRMLAAALHVDDAIEVRDGAAHELAGDLALTLGRTQAAREHYAAALSFEDGTECAQRLARLELLSNANDRAIGALASAPRADDPSLMMLLSAADAPRAVKDRMAKDPEDLLAAIPFALADAKRNDAASLEIRSAPVAVQRDALFACTLLDDPYLAATAVERTSSAWTQAPKSLFVALLHARALHATGDGAAAAALHARLYDEGRRTPFLWNEVARCAAKGSYAAPKAILAELRAIVASQPATLRPSVISMLTLEAASEAERLGQPDVALGIRADAWRFYPEASGATVADAEALRAAGRTIAAVELLAALRSVGDEESRTEASEQLYQLAIDAGPSMQPVARAALRANAAEDIAKGRSVGPAFQFLAHDEATMAAEKLDTALGWATTALNAACMGEADWDCAEHAIRIVRQRTGVAGALRFVEQGLASWAFAMPLWLRRSELRIELAEVDDGIADARAMLGFTSDPRQATAFIALAAAHRRSSSSDLALVAGAPVEILASPEAKLAAGMLALREGRPEEAEQLLASAGADSAVALYARALANTMRTAPTARESARKLFEELRQRYPSSSLARNVGSFAVQLAPN